MNHTSLKYSGKDVDDWFSILVVPSRRERQKLFSSCYTNHVRCQLNKRKEQRRSNKLHEHNFLYHNEEPSYGKKTKYIRDGCESS